MKSKNISKGKYLGKFPLQIGVTLFGDHPVSFEGERVYLDLDCSEKNLNILVDLVAEFKRFLK